MKKTYLLMNKDRPLLEFYLKDGIEDYQCIELSRKNDLPEWFTTIDEWIENRNYAKHKDHLKKWLREWGIDNKKGFIEITHGLGLNDTLWVKEENSLITWEKINLYENEFSDISERTAFETGLHGLVLPSTSPELVEEGSFNKCWKREKDKIVILKRGSEGFRNAGLEPYSEFYTSDIAKAICDSSVKYDIVNFKGYVCSKCNVFTNQDIGFVPFYKISSAKNISGAFDKCKEMGYENEFRQMIVLDSIIFNADRHPGNFGFLINNDSFDIKGFAPIFDHNMSLLCRAMDDDLKNIEEYLSGQGHKMGGEYDKVGAALMTNEIRARLHKAEQIEIRSKGKINLPEERLKAINDIYHKQIETVLYKSILNSKTGVQSPSSTK